MFAELLPPPLALLRRLLTDPWVGRSYILRTLSEPFEIASGQAPRVGPLFNPASDPTNVAGLGVNGFGYFPRKESNSAAGTKPGNTNNQLGTMVVKTQDGFPINNVGIDKKKMDPRLGTSGMTEWRGC